MKLAKLVKKLNFVDTRIAGVYQILVLDAIEEDLNRCHPLVLLYSKCIKNQRSFSNVAEYLYYSLMYKSPIPVEIDKYLADRTENEIIVEVRDLKSKHKSILPFVNRLNYYIFLRHPQFNLRLSLNVESLSITETEIRHYGARCASMRFNYLNRFVIKLGIEPNTMTKILMYLNLLR